MKFFHVEVNVYAIFNINIDLLQTKGIVIPYVIIACLICQVFH